VHARDKSYTEKVNQHMVEIKVTTESMPYEDRERTVSIVVGDVELREARNEVRTEDGRLLKMDRPVQTSEPIYLEVPYDEVGGLEQYREHPGALEGVTEVRDGEVRVKVSELEEWNP